MFDHAGYFVAIYLHNYRSSIVNLTDHVRRYRLIIIETNADIRKLSSFGGFGRGNMCNCKLLI